MPLDPIPVSNQTNDLIKEFNTPVSDEDTSKQYDHPTDYIGYNDHPLIHQAFVEAWKNSGSPTKIKPPDRIGLYGDPDTKYAVGGFYKPKTNTLAYSRLDMLQALEHQDPHAYGHLVHEMTHYIQKQADIPWTSYPDPNTVSMSNLGAGLERNNDISKIEAPINGDENSPEFHASRSGRVGELKQQQAIKKIQDGIMNNPTLPANLESTKFNGAV